MASKAKPYESFGPFVLLKKLEHDRLSELWRAVRIGADGTSALYALRRFTGGDPHEIAVSVDSGKKLLSLVTSSAIVKNQEAGSVEGIPYIAFENPGGRSLRYITTRARGDDTAKPQPIPIDQALSITERLAFALQSIGETRYQGTRLLHGNLIPQLVWISEDGESRLAGQHLAQGILASLGKPGLSAEISGYFAPEIRTTRTPTPASEVYSLGAILYLLLTGNEPPDPENAEPFSRAVATAKLMSGGQIPEDVRPLIDQSLRIDPAERYPGPAEFRAALAALIGNGPYAPTTFNLAFYLSKLLEKELAADAHDRDTESKLNLVAYMPEGITRPAGPLSGSFAPAAEPSKSRFPLIAACLGGLAVVAGIVYALTSRQPETSSAPPPVLPATSSATPTTPVAALVTPVPVETTAAQASMTPEERKKAIEAEIARRLEDEMSALQNEHDAALRKDLRKLATTATSAPSSAPVQSRIAEAAEDRGFSAAQLDQARRAEQAKSQAVQQPQQQTPPPTAASSTQPVTVPPPAPARSEVVAVREGDLVSIDRVDQRPSILRRTDPIYPPVARMQKVQGIVMVTALISENGRVLDVKILSGDPRRMLNDSAVRAVRSWTWKPAMKDGKKVRTWQPIPINFKL